MNKMSTSFQSQLPKKSTILKNIMGFHDTTGYFVLVGNIDLTSMVY